ncbi:SRPBCC family protein [Rhodoferax sp. BLA1]|uniref:SRPBCC family protein n=1 Tax=Rhodoferax sp. BLA1 TaxID=2576062 RepID=UPI0015D1613E|nr:SRPBCC family protein [Rhodoferax sp. BLA1]
MAITVKLDLGYEFAVKATYHTVFELLSDVPQSASHFPKLDKLVDLGDNVYRWEMAKIGVAKFVLQTIYASKYVSNPAKGSVIWTPVAGEGNALVSGSWKIVDKKTATHLTLKIQGEVMMPLPSLVKMVVVPAVQAEFEKLVEQYIDHLTQALGGEV